MSAHRCPDCRGAFAMGKNCPTCHGSRYVRRNTHGRIVAPATAEEFLRDISVPPRLKPLRHGKPSRY